MFRSITSSIIFALLIPGSALALTTSVSSSVSTGGVRAENGETVHSDSSSASSVIYTEMHSTGSSTESTTEVTTDHNGVVSTEKKTISFPKDTEIIETVSTSTKFISTNHASRPGAKSHTKPVAQATSIKNVGLSTSPIAAAGDASSTPQYNALLHTLSLLSSLLQRFLGTFGVAHN